MLLEGARIALWLALALDLGASAYILLLVIASLAKAPAASARHRAELTRFVVIVPAHNEEALIAVTLRSLLSLRYPRGRYSIHLIADNCTDATAIIGWSLGVHVHERTDPAQPGKGRALRWLLDQLSSDPTIDAFAFVDADSVVDANFLACMDARLAAGAEALQASYRVQEPGSHPLIGLRALAFALFHDLRGRGKARLGLSCGLWGNGMAMSRDCVLRNPWQSFSAVEDAEQHLRLLLNGESVVFVPETHVYGYMPASFGSAKDQQQRWEGGRLLLARRFWPALISDSLRRRSAPSAAALIELVLPPLSVQLIGGVLVTLGSWLIGSLHELILAAACLVVLALYLLRGLLAAALPFKAYFSLLYAPVYVAWKVWLFALELLRHREPAWLRTARTR